MIPILDLKRQYQALQAQMEQSVLQVMASGTFILGPHVKAFEQEVAQYLGVAHAIGCASGTDALYLALRALEIGPGDEVITTAFSYIATSEAIARVGATPVFAELDPHTYNLDLAQIEAKITPRTRALLPVHLYGQAVDMSALGALAKKHQLAVIEDCAQAMGASWQGQKVGSIGDIGCFSFFPTKNLGCYGDGGLVTTQNPALAEKLQTLRVHGSVTRYHHDLAGGLNSRLDEIQAAVLRIKLPHLDAWNQRRREIARQYTEGFAGISGLITPSILSGGIHAFHQYTLRLEGGEAIRDQLIETLAQQGINAMIYYPIPLHLQGAHRSLGYGTGDLPVTEKVVKEVFSLPMFPEITPEEIQQVIAVVKQSLLQLRQPA